MSRYKDITKEYTIWCSNDFSKPHYAVPYGHVTWEQESYMKSKEDFVRLKERQGWKYVKGRWYCPSCAKTGIMI